MTAKARLVIGCWLVLGACTGDDTGGDDTGTSNDAPIASAGTDQTVAKAALVTLDGSASSDPDGDDLTYAWTQVAGPSVSLSSATVANPSFTAPASTSELAFALVVSDGEDESAFDSVTITVQNGVPAASAGADQVALKRAPVTLNGTLSSDPDGDAVTWSWRQISGTAVTLSSTTASQPTITAPSRAGALVFGLVVSDADDPSPEDTVQITVSNRTPTANAGSDKVSVRGAGVTLNGTGSTDPDADPLTYAWTQTSGTAVVLSSATAAQPTFTAPMVIGTLGFGLVVTDIDGGVSLQDTVNVVVGNAVPTADAGPDALRARSSLVTLDGTASTDPDGVGVTYAWTQSSGPTVTLSDPTAAEPTFTAPAGNAVLVFGLVVTDADAAPSPQDTVTITIGNLPPVADAGPDDVAYGGDTVTLDGTGSDDPEGTNLVYAWTQIAGPAVTLSNATVAQPTFTAPAPVAMLVFGLVVTDDEAAPSAQDTVTISIASRAPIADAGEDGSVYRAVTVILDGSGSSDGDDDALTYTWRQISGTPVTLSSTTAVSPTFTSPATLGDLVFGLVVTDVHAVPSTEDTVTLTIENQPPVANAGADDDAFKGDTVTLDGTGSDDPDAVALTYAWVQVSGTTVSLSSATASKPSFTAPAVVGTLVFGLVVTDGDGAPSSQDTVSIDIDNRAPFADAGPDDTLYKNDSGSLDGTASYDLDGDAITYEWRQVSGAEVTLSSTTDASPTFTAPADSGTLVFGLEVTDVDDATSTEDTVSITVQNRTPIADAGADAGTTRNALVTLDGTDSSDEDGDDLTFEWTQISGTSVTLSDATATQPTFTAPMTLGPLVFELVVTDTDLQASDEDSVTITVGNANPVASAGSDQTPPVLSTVTLDGTGSTDDDPDSLTYAWTQLTGPSVTLADATTAQATFVAPPRETAYSFRLTVTDGDSVQDTDDVLVTLTNDPPEASALDLEANGGELVWLDATGSTDPEGGRLSCRWKQTGGPTAGLAEPTSCLLPLVLPNPKFGGLATFEVTVDDGENTDTAVATIGVYSTPTDTMWPGGAPPSSTFPGVLLVAETEFAAWTAESGLLEIYDTASVTVVASSALGNPAGRPVAHVGKVVLAVDPGGSVVEVWREDPQNPGLLVKAQFNPDGTLNGEYALSADASIALIGVTADGGASLVVGYDLTQAPPALIFTASFGTNIVTGLAADETRMFVATKTMALATTLWTAPLANPFSSFQNSDPCTHPNVRASSDILQDLFVDPRRLEGEEHGSTLYGACEQGLVVFDIHDPDVEPVPIGGLGTARGSKVHGSGDTLVVGGELTGVYEVDVSDRATPTLTGTAYGPRMVEVPLALQAFEVLGMRFAVWQVGLDQTVLIEPTSLPLVPAAEIPGFQPQKLGAGAGLLYMGDDAGVGTDLYDVTDPTSPAYLTSALAVPNYGTGYALRSPWSLLVGSNDAISEVDVASAQVTNVVQTGESHFDHLRVLPGDYAVASHVGGLMQVDLDAPFGSNTTSVYSGSPGSGMAMDGTSVWTSFGDTTFRSFDLTHDDPPLIASVEIDTSVVVNDLVSVGHSVFMAVDGFWHIWADDLEPEHVFLEHTNGSLADITASGSLALAANGNGLGVWDMTDPLAPSSVAYFQADGWVDRVATDAGWAWVVNRDGDRIEGYDLRPAAFETRQIEVYFGNEIPYTITWSDALEDDVVCMDNCDNSMTSPVYEGNSATFTWFAPQTVCDQPPCACELVCRVGNDVTHVLLRDRVLVSDPTPVP